MPPRGRLAVFQAYVDACLAEALPEEVAEAVASDHPDHSGPHARCAIAITELQTAPPVVNFRVV